MTPRVRYENKTHWRSVCEESMDMLAHGLSNYIKDNLVSGTSIEEMGGIPMVLPKFELEIDTQLRACLEQITQNKPWSTRRAKEISLGLGTSFASFGGGVGLLTGEAFYFVGRDGCVTTGKRLLAVAEGVQHFRNQGGLPQFEQFAFLPNLNAQVLPSLPSVSREGR